MVKATIAPIRMGITSPSGQSRPILQYCPSENVPLCTSHSGTLKVAQVHNHTVKCVTLKVQWTKVESVALC